MPGRGGARLRPGGCLRPLLRSPALQAQPRPAHSPLDVGVIILQEAVLFLPVLKNVFNETAWEPHGDKSARAPKAPSPTALRSFREDLGAWQLQAVHISCDFNPTLADCHSATWKADPHC